MTSKFCWPCTTSKDKTKTKIKIKLSYKCISKLFIMHYIIGWQTSMQCISKIIRFRPWSSRIDYFENNRQNLCSHLHSLLFLDNSLLCQKIVDFLLVILTNNGLFSDITGCYLKIASCRWIKENNRLLFSVTGIDDQGHRQQKLQTFFVKISSTLYL